MNTENSPYSRLLTVPDLYSLYCRIGDSLITQIDLSNFSYDKTAVDNSVRLLTEMGLIESSNQRYAKVNDGVLLYDVFRDVILSGLDKKVLPVLDIFGENDMVFDREKASFFVSRNSVSLKLSGLIMLLAGFERVKLTKNKIYINDKSLVRRHDVSISRNNNVQTLVELKNKLSLQDQLGEDAELAAIKYEKESLLSMGITKNPIRVSTIDTTAGYDIASYMSATSNQLDKFIEVKSCSDDGFNFFISKNEINQAKALRESYFLYLYNRRDESFTVIRDPYDAVLNTEGWVVDPSVYKVKREL